MQIWQVLIAALAVALAAGIFCWLAGQAVLAVWERISRRDAFQRDLAAQAGEITQRRYRRLGRKLAVWLAALLAMLPVFLFAWWGLPGRLPENQAMWVWILAGAGLVLLFGAAAYFLVKLILERRALRFAWSARRAIGSVLCRLNTSGYRIFHSVSVEGAVIDHVVVGEKGVFAVNVVARRTPKKSDAAPMVELRNGKLNFGELTEALPVGEAAKNMTLLGAALTRAVGHRVLVRSALAVPGWQCRPDGNAHHLLLNESNIVMLPSWNTPDAYLMDEDIRSIEAALTQAAAIQNLD